MYVRSDGNNAFKYTTKHKKKKVRLQLQELQRAGEAESAEKEEMERLYTELLKQLRAAEQEKGDLQARAVRYDNHLERCRGTAVCVPLQDRYRGTAPLDYSKILSTTTNLCSFLSQGYTQRRNNFASYGVLQVPFFVSSRLCRLTCPFLFFSRCDGSNARGFAVESSSGWEARGGRD